MPELLWPDSQPSLSDGDVTLRPFQVSDREAVYRACQDPVLQQWTLVPVPYLWEHADQLTGPNPHEQYMRRGGAHFAITTNADSADGVVGVKSVDEQNESAEVGYWLGEWARNRGIASRALALMSEWLLHDVGLGRLDAYVHTGNVASWKTLANAGYEREGLVRRKFNVRGEWPDMYLYARTT